MVQFSSVQLLMSSALQPHGLQHARPPCPSPTPGACSNSYLLSLWCHTLLIPCHPIFLLPSVFPSIRVFSSGSVLLIRRPKYWSFSFSISPAMNIQDWLPLWLTGLIPEQSKGLLRVFSNTTVQKHQFFSTELSLWSRSHIHIWLLDTP